MPAYARTGELNPSAPTYTSRTDIKHNRNREWFGGTCQESSSKDSTVGEMHQRPTSTFAFLPLNGGDLHVVGYLDMRVCAEVSKERALEIEVLSHVCHGWWFCSVRNAS